MRQYKIPRETGVFVAVTTVAEGWNAEVGEPCVASNGENVPVKIGIVALPRGSVAVNVLRMVPAKGVAVGTVV